MRRYLPGNKPGFSLYELCLVLVCMAVTMGVLYYYSNKGAEEMRMTSVASHFKTVMGAAEKYVRRNDDKIRKALDGLVATTRTSGPVISIKMLLDDGALPERAAVAEGSGNETSYSAKNAWGQDYYITTRLVKGQNSGNDTSGDDLAVVVMTTGGRGADARDRDFANVVVPETAVLAGAGFVPDPTSGIYDKGVVRGPYGSWALNLSDVGLEDYDSPGHLAMLSSFDASDLKQDYLYREVIPGHPELNAMQTDLDMNKFDIDDVTSIRFNAHSADDLTQGKWECTSDNLGRTFVDNDNGLYLCRKVGGIPKWTTLSDTGNSIFMQSAGIYANGDPIEKPTCPVGSDTEPFVYATSVSAAPFDEKPEHKSPLPMHSIRTWIDTTGVEWKVRMVVLNSNNEWIEPPDKYGNLMVFTTCE